MSNLTIAQWLQAAIERKMISQAELGRRLQLRLHRSFDRSMVNKMLKGLRDVSAEEMVAIERITGHAAPSYLRPDIMRVPLISWVNAGALADASTQIPNEELPLVTFADLGAGEFFALRVEGDSMDRVSPPGSLIVVDRIERTLAPNRYYIFAARGETTYKRWHAEPPYLAPFSTNPSHEPIFLNRRKDVEVIGRVRRTVLDL
jgi:SOS-response transcriptional repressor LexA